MAKWTDTTSFGLVRRTAAVLLLVLCYSTDAGAQDAVSEAWRALELWEPLSIEQKGSSLVVTSKERSVTQTIYEAMIGAGICLYAGTGEIELDGIAEIVILNRFHAAGWVFEGGKPDCTRFAKIPYNQVGPLILGKTHMYSCSSGHNCKY